MITSMHIENFKCFKDFDIELGKFNVLVGPNDSGKTAFLQAIRLAGFTGPKKSIHYQHEIEKELGIVLGQEAIWRNNPKGQITITVCGSDADSPLHPILVIQAEKGVEFRSHVQGGDDAAPGWEEDVELLAPEIDWQSDWFSKVIGKVGYYQFEPNALRKPSTISQTMTQTGEGFPTFLDDISRAPDEGRAFRELKKHFYDRCSYYKIVTIDTDRDKNGFVLRFHTTRGEKLSSEGVSDGIMLSLAFIALNYAPKPPKILLIEEPENGVHYASLKKIISTLRELSEKKGVQVILTTHSPYLLDLVKPEEVRVFAKNEEGAVHAAKLSDHPEVEDLKKHFMTGEIWSGLDDAEVVEKCGGKK